MPVEVKSMVRLYHHGIEGQNFITVDVEKWDAEHLVIPIGYYGFQFVDILVDEVAFNGELVSLESQPVRVSGMYYINAKVYTLQEIGEESPSVSFELSIMESSGAEMVVKTLFNELKVFREDDQVIIKRLTR